MDKPYYTKKPMGSLESLAKALHIDKMELIRLSKQADSYYYLHDRKPKPNGDFRDIYGVNSKLKVIQQRIRQIIINQVYFPIYIQGSVKDIENPRSHVTAAALHQNAVVLVRLDISNFYPSISEDAVVSIWKRFFNFSPDVAFILAKLTTFRGFLPQGATTSPGLGNLVFWECESEVVAELQIRKFIYTRFVDDVSISTRELIEIKKLGSVFTLVFGMFKSKNVNPNRNKIQISTSGHEMLVHNLNVNGQTLTVPKGERKRIRAAVRECEELATVSRISLDYEEKWRSVLGRVEHWRHINPSSKKVMHLNARLKSIKPLLSDSRLAEVDNMVCEGERLFTEKQFNLLKTKYEITQRRIASLSQVYPEKMKPYSKRLQEYIVEI